MKPSLKIVVLIALCAFATAGAEGQQSPAGELLDPGWNDPFFSDYLKRQAAKPLSAKRSEPGTIEFSLPVLGFSPSDAPGGVKTAVMDLCPRSASVRAVEDCTAIRLSGADLHQVYEQDLKQFTLIQMNMGREVTRRLREAHNRLFARMGPDADLGTFSWSAEDAPGPLPRGVGSLPRWSA